MNAPWPPLELLCDDARAHNLALAKEQRALDADTAPVCSELSRRSGYDHGFVVAHVGETTRPQVILWSMRLLVPEN